MLKKAIIAILAVTVIGAGAAGAVYSTMNKQAVGATGSVAPTTGISPLGSEKTATDNLTVAVGATGPVAPTTDIVAAQIVEEPWQATGTVAAVDDYGMDLQLESGETVYVELGPPTYWQNQGVSIQTGQQVSVDGSSMDGMLHAATVTLDDGQVLQIRSESEQPLWSGGASNGQGNSDSEHTPDPQAQVDEWITYEGELLSYQNGTMTMATTEGEVITFQTGQPRFFADQGVTFQVGDAVSVLGFYQGEQFSAGEITHLSTGLRVMLRDPNGRPLWAGPGNSNDQGNGGSGNGGSGNGGSGNQSGGQGMSQGGNDQGGNGYHGGR